MGNSSSTVDLSTLSGWFVVAASFPFELGSLSELPSQSHTLAIKPPTHQTDSALAALPNSLKAKWQYFQDIFFLGWFVILYMHHNHDKSSIREGWAALGVEDPLLNEICSKISSQKSWWGSFDTPANKYYRDILCLMINYIVLLDHMLLAVFRSKIPFYFYISFYQNHIRGIDVSVKTGSMILNVRHLW